MLIVKSVLNNNHPIAADDGQQPSRVIAPGIHRIRQLEILVPLEEESDPGMHRTACAFAWIIPVPLTEFMQVSQTQQLLAGTPG